MATDTELLLDDVRKLLRMLLAEMGTLREGIQLPDIPAPVVEVNERQFEIDWQPILAALAKLQAPEVPDVTGELQSLRAELTEAITKALEARPTIMQRGTGGGLIKATDATETPVQLRSSTVWDNGSTYQPLSANDSFTSDWKDVQGWGSIVALVNTSHDADLAFEWSHDGVTVDKTTTFAHSAGSGTHIAPLQAQYLRTKITDTSGSNHTTTIMHINLKVEPPSPDFVELESTLTDDLLGILGRTVLTGKTPSGNYRNAVFNGSLPGYNPINESLSAGESYIGPWDDISGQVSVAGFILADAVSATDGIRLQFSQDAATVDQEFLLTYETDDVNQAVFFAVPARGSYVRLKYDNGGSAATVQGHLETGPDAFQQPMTQLSSRINKRNLGILTRSVLTGEDELTSGLFRNAAITQDGGVHVKLAASDSPVQPKPAESNDGGIRYTLSDTANTNLTPSPLTNRMMVWITNGGAKDIRVGLSSGLLSSGGGHLLQPGASVFIGVTSGQTIFGRSTSGNQNCTVTQFANPDQANA